MYRVNLNCGNCRKFNHSVFPPRCVPAHNVYTKADSAACGHFHRIVDVRVVPKEHPMRRKDDLKV